MGAKFGKPDSVVWAVDGDGCFQMTNQELATCALEGAPIKVAVINNGSLGMVRQWQNLFYNSRYSNTDLNYVPDFVKLADAYGCVGLRCESAADVVYVRQRVPLVIQGFAAGDPAISMASEGPADIVLLDAPDPGSGRVFDWYQVSGALDGVRLLLAGGLTPDNVAEAIRRVRPWGVDVSTGVEIASQLRSACSVVPIIKHHHERFDGTGYPDGLAGGDIPQAARIVSVCDAYDAMTSDRPYRRAMSSADAIAELRRGAGTQWDPELVGLFLSRVMNEPADADLSPLSFASSRIS